ncbi:LysR family transcriptional regulator [Roseibium sp. MMSF_3544]|uniref:LysR family transcriptional regulator n=1 Tax=unclassified Roseibium TaxID=2629323 RepID=UPI00273FE898|nr:LysR family transcriptional regulator [Roseibium sp. MMSF_3544]
MNWDAISFDWNQVRAFLATVEEGTFSAAARVLKTTQPTIGRQIAELEDRLGVTLLERSVKGPRLTEAGESLLHHVRAMSDAATMISMAAIGQSAEVSGRVRITASDMLAVGLIPSLLSPLRKSAPGIRPELLPSNDIKDLLSREADIAVRHVRPEQPELIARHVADLPTGLYGSRTYFEAVERPSTPRDAADHAFIGIPSGEGLLSTLRSLGIPLTQDSFVVTSDSGVVISGCLKAGFGLSLLPVALCDPEPDLERVLPDLPTPQIPVWLVTHRELRTSKRIRLVFDRLAHGLAQASAQLRN